ATRGGGPSVPPRPRGGTGIAPGQCKRYHPRSCKRLQTCHAGATHRRCQDAGRSRRDQPMPRIRVCLVALACACLGLTSAALAAQQQLGTIQGTITDQTHGVLPGVAITVTNLDTNISRTATSNETGVFRVPSLDPGRYRVAAELQGFKTATQTDVVLSVGATLGVNFTMAPGTLEESIQVRGIAPDIQTEKADVSA